jgi:hypothetical protein
VKYLLVAGCSNSFGAETLGDFNISPESVNHAYGYHIAKHLNLEYINISYPGISNTEITYRLFEWLYNNKDKIQDTLIIVGWTGIGRVRLDITRCCNTLTVGTMWMYTHDRVLKEDGTWTACADLCSTIDPDKTFFKTYLKYFAETQDVFIRETMCKLSVDQFLQKHNAHYLTFVCDHNMKPLWSNVNKFFKSFFSEKNNITDYSVIIKCGNKYGVAKGGHINKRGQLEAAKIIMDELYKREIINTVAFSSKFLYK